jgi:arabinose-5-phosphate isomerase
MARGEMDADSAALPACASLLDDVFADAISALDGVRPRVARGFDDAVALMLACRGKVVVTGVGKSGIVGLLIAALLNSTGTPAVFMNAGEALHGDVGVVSRDDLVVMLSKSAETPELTALLPSLRRTGATCIGIFGRADTPLGRAMEIRLDAATGREACGLDMTPTASATAMLVIGHAIALALAAGKGITRERLAMLHPGATSVAGCSAGCATP